MADDFGAIGGGIDEATGGKKSDAYSYDKGEKRAYLRVYETLPPQMLNAYGLAKFQKMSDDAVWTAMSEPLKTGAL